jgi:hypothetical protein
MGAPSTRSRRRAFFRTGVWTQGLWQVAGIAWFCTEIGQFIEQRSWIGQEPLFWPLWCCVCVILFLAMQLLDARDDQEEPEVGHEEESRMEGNSTTQGKRAHTQRSPRPAKLRR